MSTTPRIVSFSDPVAPERSRPDPDRLLSGTPEVTAWNHYADGGERFFAGVWAATRGAWRVRYSEHEFCHLLSGRVRITASAGGIAGGGAERHEFVAGDSFVIPAGFEGTWEVIEDCRKLYVIYQGTP